MRRFTKICYALAGLLVLLYVGATAGVVYQFVWRNPKVWMSYFDLSWEVFLGAIITFAIVAGVTALVGLIVLARGLFSRRNESRLNLGGEEGSIEVTEEAIRSMIRASLKAFPVELGESEVFLNNKKQRLSAELRLGVSRDADLNALGAAIGSRLRRDLVQLTGMAPTDISLVFHRLVEPAKAGEHS